MLAFPRQAYARSERDPVLYLHPKFQGTLPDALMALPRHELDGRTIHSFPATA